MILPSVGRGVSCSTRSSANTVHAWFTALLLRLQLLPLVLQLLMLVLQLLPLVLQLLSLVLQLVPLVLSLLCWQLLLL